MQPRIVLNTAATDDLIERVVALDRKVRRRALYRVGTEVGKIQLAAMKATAKTGFVRRTGALEKSLGRKVSLRPPFVKLNVIVGPRRGKTKGGVLQRLRFPVFRQTRAGRVPVLNRRGEQLVRKPTRYAHLAGPRRKSVFVQQAQSRTEGAVKAKMVQVLSDAIATP